MKKNNSALEPPRLWRWCSFLDNQTHEFQSRIVAIHGRPFVADETTVAFLQVDESTNRPIIDQAVRDFISSGKWPPGLTLAQLLNLRRRLTVASCVVQKLLKGEDGRMIGIPVADPDDAARFVEWLLIDTWNVWGKKYIRGLTKAWFAPKSPRPRS
jgi:hypothetical protein